MIRIAWIGVLMMLAFGCRTTTTSGTKDLAIDASQGGKFSLYRSTGEGKVGRYICPASAWSEGSRVNPADCALKVEARTDEFLNKLKELFAEINDGEISRSQSRLADRVVEVIESDQAVNIQLYNLLRRNMTLERMLTLIPLAMGETAIPPNPQVCTRDFNQWGFPSRCSCPAGGTYNPQTGNCEDGPSPTICTRDFNRWGNPSNCSCPEGYRYVGQTGRCAQLTAGIFRVTVMGSGTRAYASVTREADGQTESIARNINCSVLNGFGAISGTHIDCEKNGIDVRLRSRSGEFSGKLTIETDMMMLDGDLRCASPAININPGPGQPPIGGIPEYIITKCVHNADDDATEINCDQRPPEPGFCCAAETASCIACRQNSARARALLERWESECVNDPIVDCENRPPDPVMCCMAMTPGCRSCAQRSRRMAEELAQWEQQCQNDDDGVPCEREIALLCDPPLVDGCLIDGPNRTPVHRCVEDPNPLEGIPCEREVLLGCRPPLVDGCVLTGEGATRVHRCVEPPSGGEQLRGYNFEGEQTCNPLPAGWACPQVATPESDACYSVGGRTLYCEGCAILCDRPISNVINNGN